MGTASGALTSDQFMMMGGGMMKERPPPPPHTNLLHMAGKFLFFFKFLTFVFFVK